MSASAQPMSHMTSKREYAAESRIASACSNAESRSTSAGSNESGDLYRQGPLASVHSAFPDHEYPVPFVVRNTFIDTQVVRPLSLDEFFQERRIHSCPVAAHEDEESSRLDEVEDEIPTAQPLRRAITAGAHALMTTVGTATGFWPTLQQANSAVSVEATDASQAMPRLLMLSEALPEPLLGSDELPTIGSAGHNIGNCKPCAFFHTRGCGNGLQCSFCHLCPADEKRKRQKDKLAAYRDTRQQRRQVRL